MLTILLTFAAIASPASAGADPQTWPTIDSLPPAERIAYARAAFPQNFPAATTTRDDQVAIVAATAAPPPPRAAPRRCGVRVIVVPMRVVVDAQRSVTVPRVIRSVVCT